MARTGRRVRPDGRSGGEQYLPLPYRTVQSPAWRSLSGTAAKVFIELRSRYNGGNNGKLRLSFAEGSKLLGIGRASLGRAFDELEAKGFIRQIKPGHWYGRQATEWAVTDRGYDGYPPSNEWLRWQPPARPNS